VNDLDNYFCSGTCLAAWETERENAIKDLEEKVNIFTASQVTPTLDSQSTN
jgi:hypothetical protein